MCNNFITVNLVVAWKNWDKFYKIDISKIWFTTSPLIPRLLPYVIAIWFILWKHWKKLKETEQQFTDNQISGKGTEIADFHSTTYWNQ